MALPPARVHAGGMRPLVLTVLVTLLSAGCGPADYDPAVTTEPEAPPAGLPFLVVLTGWGADGSPPFRAVTSQRPTP